MLKRELLFALDKLIMKTPPYTKRKGFTLIELTIVLLLTLFIGAATLGLFNQQINTMRVISQQNFLLRDAPEIVGIVNRIIPRANAFQMFTNTGNLGTGVTSDATVLALRFQDSSKATAGDTDLSFNFSAIVFNATTGDLEYYNNLNSTTQIAGATPNWIIATNVTNTVFSVDGNGVILMTITGPRGESITYASTTLN